MASSSPHLPQPNPPTSSKDATALITVITIETRQSSKRSRPPAQVNFRKPANKFRRSGDVLDPRQRLARPRLVSSSHPKLTVFIHIRPASPMDHEWSSRRARAVPCSCDESPSDGSPGRDPSSKLHRELNKLIRLASRMEQWIALATISSQSHRHQPGPQLSIPSKSHCQFARLSVCFCRRVSSIRN